MRISSLELKNFKRFTDLRIENIPSDAKLVLLIGSNGSGKSCVFDAFRLAENRAEGIATTEQMNYYVKNKLENIHVVINPTSEYTLFDRTVYPDGRFGEANGIKKNNFFGRTSFRQISRLLPRNGNEIVYNNIYMIERNSEEFAKFIDRDNLFINDIETISSKALADIFRSERTRDEIFDSYIRPINDAFVRIFAPDDATKLTLLEITPQTEQYAAQINFRKGESEIHYNLLSAGEKEVVNILLNLLVRREDYKDTVYYLDELDLHLNTKLQYNLIKEITENWIPDNCQLWTASHSLGFIDYASDATDAVILDFDDLDFDKPQIIKPSDKKDYQVFELAVGKQFIDKVFQDKRIVFAENTDTAIYNDLSFTNTFFFTAIDKLDVFTKSKNLKTLGLIDRDYLTDDEVALILQTYSNLRILPYYSIENLVYHPDNVSEYCIARNIQFDKPGYTSHIIGDKNKLLLDLVSGIAKARDGYPFFKENKQSENLKKFKSDYKALNEILKSDDFETFYKVYPMKDSERSFLEKLNLKKNELSKTSWFRKQIENAL